MSGFFGRVFRVTGEGFSAKWIFGEDQEGLRSEVGRDNSWYEV